MGSPWRRDGSVGGFDNPRNSFQERRLARTVSSQYDEQLTFMDVHGDSVKGLNILVVDIQVTDFKYR